MNYRRSGGGTDYFAMLMGMQGTKPQEKCALPECLWGAGPTGYCSKHQYNIDTWLEAWEKRKAVNELAHGS